MNKRKHNLNVEPKFCSETKCQSPCTWPIKIHINARNTIDGVNRVAIFLALLVIYMIMIVVMIIELMIRWWRWWYVELTSGYDNSTEVTKQTTQNHAVRHNADTMWSVSAAAGGQTVTYTDTRQKPEAGASFVQFCCYSADVRWTGAVTGAF